MQGERWQRIERLFQGALELSSRSRAAYLDRECRGDLDMRKEVEALLLQQTRGDSLLELRELTATQTILARQLDPGCSQRMRAGSQLGSYQILDLLGKGGMGEVYRAHDCKLGRDVAIKTLPAEFAGHAQRLARFQREARTLASLNHPNVAAIYGLEESQEATCLVLELVEGETLKGPLPISKALDYARQIAEGLEAAHAKGVVHRDLKPANIKVTPQGRIKILDFGLAKAVWGGSDAQNLSEWTPGLGPETAVGHIVGTPPYMSPEQASGQEVDHRTDIWAFGCVLYELLSGKRAFPGETLGAILDAILEHEPDWSALPTKTPPKIVELLEHCLNKSLDLRVQDIRDARAAVEKVQKGRNHWKLAAMIAAVLSVLVAGAALWLREPAQPATRDQWVQLTKFPDSVSQPALSINGGMVTFIRGPSTFFGAGQVYVKVLPDGEPRKLTNDDYMKMSPVFSPDGSRIAYTTVDRQFKWDTWTVPASGGQPERWLANAGGLVWKDARAVLFSKLLVGSHMAVRMADASGAEERAVYVPERISGMAHRSYPSPDGKWALIAEMDGPWLPCRLVPLDGSSQGHRVGPQTSACTFAAWSPDGKWMYFTSSAGGAFHTWRERFPDEQLEQITSGPTEEEGIAVAPDGRSFVTAVGQRQRSISLHGAKGDRQISLEGYAFQPHFTPDSRVLAYCVLKGSQPNADPAELWIADLDSGRIEALLPDFPIFRPPDISPDGRDVLLVSKDASGTRQLWLASLDRSSPPRQIANGNGDYPFFGPNGEIYFRATDGFAYRMNKDGSGKERVLNHSIAEVRGVSPDGKWLAVWSVDPEAKGPESATQADFVFPLGGGGPIRIWGEDATLKWSADRKSMFLDVSNSGTTAGGAGKTYVFPLSPGKMLPDIPRGGFRSEEELAKYPGMRVLDTADVAPGPTSDVYAFSKETTQRNLFRIPLR